MNSHLKLWAVMPLAILVALASALVIIPASTDPGFAEQSIAPASIEPEDFSESKFIGNIEIFFKDGDPDPDDDPEDGAQAVLYHRDFQWMYVIYGDKVVVVDLEDTREVITTIPLPQSVNANDIYEVAEFLAETAGAEPTSGGTFVLASNADVPGGLIYIIRAELNGVLGSVPIDLPGGASQPLGPTAAPPNVYIPRFADDSVLVIDREELIATESIDVGDGPTDVAHNLVTNRVYTPNFVDDSVSVIDGATNVVIDTIPVGDRPLGIDIDFLRNLIFVTSTGDDMLHIIDGETHEVKNVNVGSAPDGIGVNPLTGLVYVANSGDDTVSVVDPGSAQVIETLQLQGGGASAGGGAPLFPVDIEVDPLTGRFWVVTFFTSTLIEYDGNNSGPALWPDPNCDQKLDALDALVTLQDIAALPFSQTQPCPDIGEELLVASPQLVALRLWGDADCNGAITAIDALQELRSIAALPTSQEFGCPSLDSPVQIPDF